jgi:hypothetical protein
MNATPRIIYGLSAATLAGIAVPAQAQQIDVSVTIPRLQVAEYHRPYVAIWIEQPGGTTVRTLAVWYDHDMRENEGNRWLRDLRTWWRKVGRTQTMPANGISGATRAPGPQRQTFTVSNLPAGNYELVVEAAREVGGREVVRLPFRWPASGNATVRGTGSTELGAVTATIRR